MAVERRDNDRQLEELRAEADETEAKVCFLAFRCALRVMIPCQMAEYLKKSEAELNELLAEYWKLRHETGMADQCLQVCY
jgi:kinetochore protein Nuf2